MLKLNNLSTLNSNASKLEILHQYPYNDEQFMIVFNETLDKYESTEVEEDTDRLTTTIKEHYKDIIKSKIILDTVNDENGPKTFEAL